MKNLKLFKNATIAVLIAVSAASCSKNNDQPSPAISALSFIHASPDAPPVSILVDKNQVSNDLFSYTDHIDYLNAYSGDREVFAYEGDDQKISSKITLEKGKYYSLFLAGKWASAEFVLLEDSLKNPDQGKALIRFVNMSADAPSLDLGLVDGSTLVSGKAYKENNGFIAVAGDTKYSFVIRDHGATAAKVSLPETTLDAGHIYTVWAKGTYADSGSGGIGGELLKNY